MRQKSKLHIGKVSLTDQLEHVLQERNVAVQERNCVIQEIPLHCRCSKSTNVQKGMGLTLAELPSLIISSGLCTLVQIQDSLYHNV